MVISREEQIEQRRAKVLELYSQGLTQQEIAKKIADCGIAGISQRTVSNDIAWLRKDAIKFLQNNREHIAFEHKQVLSNMYQLRKEVWNHFNGTKNEQIKMHLYSVIQSINNNIETLLLGSDSLAQEFIAEAQEAIGETKEELQALEEEQQ